jgi:hypothetical protein
MRDTADIVKDPGKSRNWGSAPEVQEQRARLGEGCSPRNRGFPGLPKPPTPVSWPALPRHDLLRLSVFRGEQLSPGLGQPRGH